MNHRSNAVSLNVHAIVAAISLAVPTLGAAGLTNDLAFSEELPFADVAVIARLVDSTPAVVDSQGMPVEQGRTTFEVVHVVKVAPGESAPGQTIESRYYFDEPQGSLFMLYAVNSRTDAPWVTREPISEECAAYVLGIAALDTEGADRLRYFSPFLQHADPKIAADAVREFGLAEREDVATVVAEIGSNRIAAWILDEETDPSFVGIYSWMLGVAGAEQTSALRELVMRQPEGIHPGRDGLMVGYALLAGREGWELIEREKFLNRDAPFSETYSALMALRYLWTHPVDDLPRERLVESMHLLLDRPELADLIISDLARWKDWSVVDRLYEMYDAEGFQEPATKRAIIRYLLMAQHAGCQAVADGAEIPEFADRATQYLDDIKRRDPDRVEQAERYFTTPGAGQGQDDASSPSNQRMFNPLLNRDWWRC